MNKVGKFRMIIEELNKITAFGGKAMLIYHFEETKHLLEELLNSSNLSFSSQNTADHKVLLVKSDNVANVVSNKNNACVQAIVSEIYPLSGKDELIYTTIHQYLPNALVIFYTSTDSPIMKAFGGGKIQSMMKTLGLDENEKIEHGMVSKSILRAQEKIKEKVLYEQPASSKQEWMDINVKAKD